VFRFLALLARQPWLVRLANPLFGLYNPMLPERRQDPYPIYRRMRERASVYLHPLFRAWFLTRHADIQAVLRDPRFIANRTQSELFRKRNPFRNLPGELRDAITRTLLMLDAPDHTRIRNLVGKAFTPRTVERLTPRIQAITDELLDAVAPGRDMDLVRDLAYPLPVTVIAELLGVPTEDRDRLKQWSDHLAVLVDPISNAARMEVAAGAYLDLTAYMAGIFAERRREPRDDLISALVAAEQDGDHLDEVELQALCGLILGAGHETTSNLIANSVLLLLRHPGERKRLQDDPGLLEPAIEEFLRFEPPVQGTDRVASVDCEIEGHRVRKGQFVVLLLAAANRDPERFVEPDRLDIGRPDNPHLSFGYGAHFCLGAHLARVEARIALGSLLRRFPDFDGPKDPPDWVHSLTLRGPTALPLTL
jgi:cytochrome P450